MALVTKRIDPAQRAAFWAEVEQEERRNVERWRQRGETSSTPGATSRAMQWHASVKALASTWAELAGKAPVNEVTIY